MNITIKLNGHRMHYTGNKITRRVLNAQQHRRMLRMTDEVRCELCHQTWPGMGLVTGHCDGPKGQS